MKKSKNPYATLSQNTIKAPKSQTNNPTAKSIKGSGDKRAKET